MTYRALLSSAALALLATAPGHAAGPSFVGNVYIDGSLDPEVYTVPSIEEHAAAMWANKHLPAVGPTAPDQPINMTVKMLRMLNELEHAHIYIEQLNRRVRALEAKIAGEG